MKKVKFLKNWYLVGMCISFLMFAASIVISIYYNKVVYLVDGIPFVVYGVLLLDLWNKQETLEKHMIAGIGMVLSLEKMMSKLSCYEKLYGKLPEVKTENKEEQSEEKKEE